jgi:surface protein
MFNGIKSNNIIMKIFENLQKKIALEIIRHNKRLQNNTKKSLKDYKAYYEIKIELILTDNLSKGDVFINFIDDSKYFHIYIDNDEKEIKENFINNENKINKIKISLDSNIKSLRGLFQDCKCLKEIKFTKFNNKYITDLSAVFENCTSLIKLDISKIKTDNVTKMDWMFYKCESLPEVNLQNFKTEKVTDMSCMFKNCSLLKELNLSNFNTSNVTSMKGMFYKCLSLENLDLSSFNTSNVTDMRWMFDGCSSLLNLNIYNFDTSKVTDMRWIFEGCSPLINVDISQNIMNGDVDFESSLFMKEIKIK